MGPLVDRYRWSYGAPAPMNGLTCTISMGYVFLNPYKWSYAALLITGDGKKFIKRYPKFKIQVSWTVQPMMLGRYIGARNDVLSCILYNFLYSLLSSKNFLTSSNSGFREGHCCRRGFPAGKNTMGSRHIASIGHNFVHRYKWCLFGFRVAFCE